MSLQTIIEQYLAEAKEILEEKLGHTLTLDSIKMNGRMTKCLGRASYSRKSGKVHYKIVISSVIFKSDSNQLRSTVFHEAAHIADHQINGTMNHGDSWKKIMEALDQEPSRLVSVSDLAEIGYEYKRRRQARFPVVCVDNECGRKYMLTRARHSKLHKYQCHCGCRLVDYYED